MKVHTRLVLDWDGEVLKDEFFHYEGPVSSCGGGSKGSSSSSSKQDWPSYMKDRHSDWMSQLASRIPGYNPYSTYVVPAITTLTNATSVPVFASYLANRAIEIRNMAYSPNVREPALQQALHTFMLNQVDYLSTHLGTAYNIDETTPLPANIAKLDLRLAQLETIGDLEGVVDLHTVVYPRFEAGMRDINAVQSSTFVIGRGVIEATYQAKMQELKYNWIGEIEKLRTGAVTALSQLLIEARKSNQAYRTSILNIINGCLQLAQESGKGLDTVRMEIDKFIAQIQMEIRKLKEDSLKQMDSMNDALANKDLEFRRLSVVAMMEQATTNMETQDKRYRWELENYQYGANMLGAISGGTAAAGSTGKPSKAASAIGGALSGAAAGAMVGATMGSSGGPIGAAIGGIVGLGASFL